MIYIAILFFIFFILIIAFYKWQYMMVFSPVYYRKEELDNKFTILSLKTDDGVELEGVVYEPKKPSSTLLFFAGRSHDSVGLIKKLSTTFKNARIITFNYRSYGKSQGVASEKNILKDGLEIAEFVQKNYGDYYILGFSLGSSVAAFVASKIDVLGVFLVASFDSMASLAKEKFVKRGIFPMIDMSEIFRYKFNNSIHVQGIESKTYLFVSKHDETTYIQNARNLRDNIKNLEFYQEFDDLNHKEILWYPDVVEKINGVIG